MRRSVSVLAAIAFISTSAAAQQWQADVHANYARTTRTHANQWGAGAQIQATWGGSQAAVQLGTSLAGDWTEQEHGGPRDISISYDATVQPGGSHAITPYVGGSIGANWLSGGGAPSGALLGLQYIVGAQFKPEAQSAMALKVEVRPGYVRTQEHSITYRFGVVFSI